MNRKHLIGWMLILLSGLSACARASSPLPPTLTLAPAQPAAPSLTPNPTSTPYPTPTKRASITPEPTHTLVAVTVTPMFNPAGQRITFQAGDGVELVGYYYVAPQPNSPVVVLMHQHLSSQQEAWPQSELIPWLQNYPASSADAVPTLSAQGKLPPMPPGVYFNVLTFDFRGHGESAGTPAAYISPEAQKGYLLDAQAAYARAREMPNADLDRIIGFGASIGADAVVDACDEGCAGAFSISPGSWLGLDWAVNASRVTNAGKPVRCMYSFNDGITGQTCASLPVTDLYRIAAYEGKKHGQDFLVPRKMEANFGEILLAFLLAASR